MVQGLYKGNIHQDVFVNLSELFCIQMKYHVINSEGVDVSFNEAQIKGESVAARCGNE